MWECVPATWEAWCKYNAAHLVTWCTLQCALRSRSRTHVHAPHTSHRTHGMHSRRHKYGFEGPHIETDVKVAVANKREFTAEQRAQQRRASAELGLINQVGGTRSTPSVLRHTGTHTCAVLLTDRHPHTYALADGDGADERYVWRRKSKPSPRSAKMHALSPPAANRCRPHSVCLSSN